MDSRLMDEYDPPQTFLDGMRCGIETCEAFVENHIENGAAIALAMSTEANRFVTAQADELFTTYQKHLQARRDGEAATTAKHEATMDAMVKQSLRIAENIRPDLILTTRRTLDHIRMLATVTESPTMTSVFGVQIKVFESPESAKAAADIPGMNVIVIV